MKVWYRLVVVVVVSVVWTATMVRGGPLAGPIKDREDSRHKRDLPQRPDDMESKPEVTGAASEIRTRSIAVRIPEKSKLVPFSPRLGSMELCADKLPGVYPILQQCTMFYVCNGEHTMIHKCFEGTVFYELGENVFDCLAGFCMEDNLLPIDQSPNVVMDEVVPLNPFIPQGSSQAGPPGYQPTGDKVELVVIEEEPTKDADHIVKTVIIGSNATVSGEGSSGGFGDNKRLSINIPIKIIQQ